MISLALLALVSALPPVAQGPPYYYCEVTRTVPLGNVTVLQYVNTNGASEAPVTSWFVERSDGTAALTAWNSPEERTGPGDGGEMYFGYHPSDPTRPLRVEIGPVGAAPDSTRVLRSELLRGDASRNGLVGLRTHWRPVMALIDGGADLEVRIVSAYGIVMRRDRIAAAEFSTALRIAGEIQPEFQEMRAHYRDRCRPVDNNGRGGG